MWWRKMTPNNGDWTLINISTKEGNSDKQLRKNPAKVKLSKLIISKFESTNLDWLIFWSQFETVIDCTDIKTVRNFSYLKE